MTDQLLQALKQIAADGCEAYKPNNHVDWFQVAIKRKEIAVRAIEAYRKASTITTFGKQLNEQTMLGWQPIETAPKDGEEVLLGKDIAGTWIVRNGRWVNKEEWVPPDPNDISGWWAYCNSVSQEMLEGIYEPTHWMPLQSPPAEECEGE